MVVLKPDAIKRGIRTGMIRLGMRKTNAVSRSKSQAVPSIGAK